MNRIEILREMCITPVWVPRHAPPSVVGKPGVGESERHAAPEALVDARLGDDAVKTGSGSGSQPAHQVRPLHPAAPLQRPAAGFARAAAVPLGSAAPDPARAARIAHMDWPALKQAVASCQACGLCKTRHSTVFGSGDEAADLMIIGEAPGQEEDRQGEPFVGQAGQLLDSMLAALDLTRSKNVYIANPLKCRPPGNRNPEPLEMAQCAPHLIRQVELLAPKLMLLMGRFAVQSILETDATIASLRGKRHAWRGVPVVVTYHPAYLLRNLPDKAKAWEDLVLARAVLAEAGGV